MALACYNLISQDENSYPSIVGVRNDVLGAYNGQTVQISIPAGNALQCYDVVYFGSCPGGTEITDLTVSPVPCNVGVYCGCPAGYTIAPNGIDCILITETTATAAPVIYTALAGNPNSIFGSRTRFYETTAGRSLPATMTTSPQGFKDAASIQFNYVDVSGNTLWGKAGSNTAADGRLNDSGIWTNGGTSGSGAQLPINEWIGFADCVDVPEDGIYCIGLAADNLMRFSVNGQLIIQNSISHSFAFNYWHVFPVFLSAGINLISMEGQSTGGLAIFGAEIYKQTSDILQTYTTQSELDVVTIFSTKNKIGETFQLGELSGYSCPSGYTLNTCTPSYTCAIVERSPYVPCSYPLINCEDGTVFYVVTDLSASVGKVVIMKGIDGCWLVGNLTDQFTTTDIDIIDTFDTCKDCVKKCYLLIECNNLLPSIKTDVDLSEQVGLYIKIETCPKNCWLVTEAPDCDGTLISINPTFSFETCLECNPPAVIPTPELLKSRRVRPGYDTPGCPPEYSDKINCNFAQQIYNKILKKRYGITACCDDELDKYLLKKELLDLQAIYDPGECKSTCYTCKPPCGVTAVMTIYYPIECLDPINLTAVLEINEGECLDPTDVVSSSVKVFNRYTTPRVG